MVQWFFDSWRSGSGRTRSLSAPRPIVRWSATSIRRAGWSSFGSVLSRFRMSGIAVPLPWGESGLGQRPAGAALGDVDAVVEENLEAGLRLLGFRRRGHHHGAGHALGGQVLGGQHLGPVGRGKAAAPEGTQRRPFGGVRLLDRIAGPLRLAPVFLG